MKKNLIIIHGQAYMVKEKHFLEALRLSSFQESLHTDEQIEKHTKEMIDFSEFISVLYVPITDNIPVLMW